jgi:hypothetical protein
MGSVYVLDEPEEQEEQFCVCNKTSLQYWFQNKAVYKYLIYDKIK